MTLLMTSDRCPECDAIIYMKLYPKRNSEDTVGVIPWVTTEVDGVHVPHTIADGTYLDRDGVLCITKFDELSRTPDYVCIVCRWEA